MAYGLFEKTPYASSAFQETQLSGWSQLSDEDQRKAGLQPELIRLSIGLEHPDDILYALKEALDKI